LEENNMMADLSNVVTITMAAALKGQNADTIRRRCQRGRLEAQRLGSVWLIDRSALEAWQPRKRKEM
jgi:excisionase family DNA binding protein